MKEFILNIASELVDDCGAVSITTLNGSRTKIVEMRCAQKDIGKIIGKSGKTIMALRTLASSIAAKNNFRVVFEVVE